MGDKVKVQDLMTKNIITCDANSSIHQIAQKMKEFDIGFMPINKGYQIIGILTDRDMVIHMISNYDHKIEDYIKKDIITINQDRTIEQALTLMGEKKIKRLLVTDHKKVVGIISISDILEHQEYEIMCINTLKMIYTIENKHKEYEAEIDEFYL